VSREAAEVTRTTKNELRRGIEGGKGMGGNTGKAGVGERLVRRGR